MNDAHAFDVATLGDEEASLYFRCRELSGYPGIGGQSPIGEIQSAFTAGEFDRAITLLRKYLLDAGIDPQSKPTVNGKRMAHVRIEARIKQKNLAIALGVSPKALCHFEKGLGTLRFSRILLAAAILDVRIERLLSDSPVRRPRYDLLGDNDLVTARRKRNVS